MKAIWRPLSEPPAVPCSAVIRLTPLPGTGDVAFLLPHLARFDFISGAWLNEITNAPCNLNEPDHEYHWALEDDLVALT